MDTGHGYLLQLIFTPDGEELLTTGMDGTVRRWSVPDWSPLATWEGHERIADRVAVSPDGRLVASASSDRTVRLWDRSGGECLRVLQDRKETVSTVAFSPAGDVVAAGQYGGRVAAWRLDGEPVAAFPAAGKLRVWEVG